jgi:hypothetical protein
MPDRNPVVGLCFLCAEAMNAGVRYQPKPRQQSHLICGDCVEALWEQWWDEKQPTIAVKEPVGKKR